MTEINVRQEKIEVADKSFTVTQIPTATSGSWFTISDECDVWAAVAIDLDGSIIGWRNPPGKERRPIIEEAIKKAFGIPEGV